MDTAYVTILRIKAGRKIYHGSLDHFPLRLRKRLGGGTTRTVLVIYAAAVISGALGVVVLFVSPQTTVIIVSVSAVMALVFLVWLARVDMERA
jgi:hypothetical protein